MPCLHTSDGGRMVVYGNTVLVLPVRHELASHLDCAANDDRATPPRSMIDVALWLVVVIGCVMSATAWVW